MKEHLADIEIEPLDKNGENVRTDDNPPSDTSALRKKAKDTARKNAQAKRDNEQLAFLKPASQLNEPLASYSLPPFFKTVDILPWSRPYDYYSYFLTEAEQLAGREGKYCPAVDFFSYLPQYENMTRSQLHYYLYFRTKANAGQYLPEHDVSLAYIMLYIYEIINLPDKIPPQVGIQRLVNVWLAYRDYYHELNKYMAEWLCDYCLIYQVSLPPIDPQVLSELYRFSSLREFYFATGNSEISFSGQFFIEHFSSYNYLASGSYKKSPENFDKHIPAAMDAAVIAMGWDKSFSARTVRTERDAFCGALCTAKAKKRIRLTYMSISRSMTFGENVTGCVRYAENCLRASLKIPSRLRIKQIPQKAEKAITAYFDSLPKPQKKPTAPPVPEYEKNYDIEAEDLDPQKARTIETTSWENADRLGGESVETEAETENTVTIPPQDTEEITPSVPVHPEDASEDTPPYADILAAVRDGKDFSAACAEHGYTKRDFDRIAGEINEFYFDILGDFFLEQSPHGWQIVEEYR